MSTLAGELENQNGSHKDLEVGDQIQSPSQSGIATFLDGPEQDQIKETASNSDLNTEAEEVESDSDAETIVLETEDTKLREEGLAEEQQQIAIEERKLEVEEQQLQVRKQQLQARKRKLQTERTKKRQKGSVSVDGRHHSAPQLRAFEKMKSKKCKKNPSLPTPTNDEPSPTMLLLRQTRSLTGADVSSTTTQPRGTPLFKAEKTKAITLS